ncbi:MAG: LysR family transcriptional regulator [Elstera sp.]
MIDQLRALAVFAKTVEAGSFRAAAGLLGLSPSVVSHHIAQLEARYGVALLYRSTRKLSLTPDGQRLLASAQAMLLAAEAGLDGLAGQAQDPAGSLRVTLPAVLAMSHWTDDIAAFVRHYPKVALSLNFSDMQRNLIGDGIDVALRLGWLRDSSLKARKLENAPRNLYATPAYIARHPLPQAPVDLIGWDWIYLSGIAPIAALTGPEGETQRLEFSPRLTVDDAIAMYRFARAGLGITIGPRFLAEEDVRAGRIVEVLPAWRVEPLGLYAVWPPNARRESLTGRFVDFLAARAALRAQ